MFVPDNINPELEALEQMRLQEERDRVEEREFELWLNAHTSDLFMQLNKMERTYFEQFDSDDDLP